jgi:cell division protein FtsL
MNAAARLAYQGVLSRHLVFSHLLSRRQFAIMLLIISVLLSALSIIYVTHATRDMYASYQHNLVERDHLHMERSQLLLEQGTMIMQARIQRIAENELNMIIPGHRSIVIVRE